VLADAGRGVALKHGFAQAVQIAHHVHHAFAMLQRFAQGLTQRCPIRWQYVKTGHGQLDVVLFKSVNARKTLGGQEVAIDAEVCVSPWASPVSQLGVNPFSVHHQRRQQSNVLAFEIFQQLCGNAVRRLRRH